MTVRFRYALAGCVTALAFSSHAPAQAACTAQDVAGSYESSYDTINCTATGNSLDCCYYSECKYDLNLEVSADGTQATGNWDHKTGRTGRASFGVDAQCGLANGLWGEGDAEPSRTWAIRSRMTGGATPGTDIGSAGQSCASHDECGTGTYCAFDRTCHPDSHLPMRQLALQTVDSGMSDSSVLVGDAVNSNQPSGSETGSTPTYSAEQPDFDGTGLATTGPDVDYDAIQSDLDRQRQIETARQEREALEEELARQQNELEAQRRAEAAAEAAEAEATAASEGGIQAGSGLRTVRQHLEAWDLEGKEPSGDVRDCRSYAEMTGEIAANTRDDVLYAATLGSCLFLDAMVWTTAGAVKIGQVSAYDNDSFKEALLFETMDRCYDSAHNAQWQLPERALEFWNEKIANDNWATIGPRKIRRNIPESGNLISPGDRKFLTVSPLRGKDNLKLVLQEEDGKARVTARVCKISLANRYTLLETFSVNETPGERDNQSQRIEKTLNGVEGHHIGIVLDASGLIGRNFKYEIKLE